MNELYQLNNSYSDEVIQDMIDTYRTQTYKRNISECANIQNDFVQNGSTTRIVIDDILNEKYNMPEGTFSISLQIPIIPYYNKKQFINKYGYDKVISSKTIMEDNQIFNKAFYFFISEYMIYEVYLVMHIDTTTIFIKHKDRDNTPINTQDIYDILNDSETDYLWTVYLTQKSDYYYKYASRVNVFTNNRIYVSNLSEHKFYDKPAKNNSWTLYVTHKSSSLDIMDSTSVSLLYDDTKKDYYFEVDDSFKDFLYKTSSNMKIFITNEPNCSGKGIYVNSNSSYPIFRIPYKKNPISIENFIVWRYDAETKKKCHPIEVSARHSYPDIYDFSPMIKNTYDKLFYDRDDNLFVTSDHNVIVIVGEVDNINAQYDLFIEWNEPENSTSIFNDYIKDYIDCYNASYITDYVGGTLPEEISSYKPISELDYTSENFFSSQYKDDYRKWRLEKLKYLLKNNPSRYNELYRRIYYAVKNFTTFNFNYKEFPKIYERKLRSTAKECELNSQYVHTFEEDQTYIAVSIFSNEPIPCDIFIDGKLIPISYTMIYKYNQFVYFSSKYLEDKKDIIVEIMHNTDSIEKGELIFKSLDSSIDLEDLSMSNEVSLSNILFYDKDKNYLAKDNFEINLESTDTTVEFNNGESITVEGESASTVLYDNEDNVFTPLDAGFFIVREDSTLNTLANTYFYKIIDIKDIIVKLINDKYLNSFVNVATTNYYSTWIIENNENNSITINNFKGYPLATRFHVYKDGLLLNPSKIEVTFTKYDGEATFTSDIISNGKYTIEYVPYDEEVITDFNVDAINDKLLIYGEDKFIMPYNDIGYKIFINGKRISTNKVSRVGNEDILFIDNSENEFTKEDEIIFLRQKIDNDYAYEYSPSNKFMTKLFLEDERLKAYLIDKYK